ncbi:MAG: DNA polymerase III subunit alpha [Planctomycetota bacterium]|nr:DNA polymerase III subunit alpha [Planctomycetota bacterium]
MSEAPDFVHLRARSHYSLLSAPADIKSLAKTAAEDGQRALALTDNGNLFGAVEFYKACKKAEIRPILGQTTYVAERTNAEKQSPGNQTFDLTLLATTNEGFDNLRKISSQAWLEGFSYRPRTDLEHLAAHSKGIIALSGSFQSQIGQALQQGDGKGALETAGQLAELFGKDNFFLEVAETGAEVQSRVTAGKKELSKRLGIPCVATNDAHYLGADDWLAHDIMLCIRNGKTVADQDRFRMSSRELHLKSRAEMAAAFGDWTEPLQQTVAIAERCDVSMEFGVYHVPVFEPENGQDPDEYFLAQCQEGAKDRYGEVTEEIQERLDYEIGIIRKLGFVSYFLITQDFIVEAKRRGIPVGPGRGSAAGSIVAYSLQITDVCPLRYSLLFERFLNPARVSMPDIDIDFCGNRRDEIIDYVREKYGSDSVCQIITFGTMASRGVLRDVGRVLGFEVAEVDQLCKKVPQGPGASLEAALETDKELQQIRDSSPQYGRLFELSLRLEGLARHSSVHAAGVVIADKPAREYVPLAKNGEDIVTQWQMTELEEVGLLKMDFLGLKTLTILAEGERLVKEQYEQELNLTKLPLDDEETYAIMTRGETQGIFQLESSGMRELLTRLKPDTFEDVIAVLALYRPGPLGSGMVDMFVRRKHGEEPVVYDHEDLSTVLGPTYGVIVYQEQVMQIANLIGDFSMSDADNLRKAMGKKKVEVMEKFKDKFVEGAKSKGYEQKFARELFETMAYFAGYGFNKSHSTAYALVTYQTAWLKAHYPLEFLAANLTVESGNSDKVKELVDDARRAGLRLLPPSVNSSQRHFSVEDGAIRYGLGAVKGVGARAAEMLGVERSGNGAFESIEDLCERLDANVLNKTGLEALVQSGALDGLGRSRRASVEKIESALRSSAVARQDRLRGQGMLFAPTQITTETATDEDLEEWPENERLQREKESLGFYLSGHPFENRGSFLQAIAGQSIKTLGPIEAGETVRIAGMVTSVRVLQIKSGRNAGKKMARFALEDLDGQIAVTCFNRAYEKFKDRIVDDAIVFVTGRIDAQSEERALLLDSIDPAMEVVRHEVTGLVLLLRGALTQESVLNQLMDLCERYKGQQQLHFDVEEAGTIHRVRAEQSIHIVSELLDELAGIVSPENMSFTRR